MTNKLYIDGIDICSEYGVFLSDGGYGSLVSYAPLKKVTDIDWAEDDGAEVDLETPVLNTRSVTLKFAYLAEQTHPEAFIEMLSDRAYHDFNFVDLERTYTLRLNGQSNLSTIRNAGAFNLQFNNDHPLLHDTDMPPLSGNYNIPQGCGIDGRSLSDYGAFVAGKSFEEISKLPKMKPSLLRNIESENGAVYDSGIIRFKTKDVTLDCLMRADTLAEFWGNYDALLHDLTKSDLRRLYLDSTGYEYSCYYKSSSVGEFLVNSLVWCRLSLVLTFTDFRVMGDENVLVTESGEWIATEANNSAIDLNENII